jgi:hypothetical protein
MNHRACSAQASQLGSVENAENSRSFAALKMTSSVAGDEIAVGAAFVAALPCGCES